MTDKEIAEIRRRFKCEKSAMATIRGCYVDGDGKIVTEFSSDLINMSEEEQSAVLSVMKKTLSGKKDRNLLTIDFPTRDVGNTAEHKLLMTLRETKLHDDSAVHTLLSRIIESVHFEDSYMILLGCDSYDVFSYRSDGTQEEDSTEIFTYITCAVCPVKLTKTRLSFKALENAFSTVGANNVITSPELGFMFPAFDDRTANIYNALYYTRDLFGKNDEFIENIFGTEKPVPSGIQKETFKTVLSGGIEEECDIEVIKDVQRKLEEIIEVNKEAKDDEPISVNKDTLKCVLRDAGIDDEKVESFSKEYDENFGENTEIAPANIMDVKKFDLVTPDVTVKVNPERADLVTTKIIDGKKYILILADDGVEVNGINVNIK